MDNGVKKQRLSKTGYGLPQNSSFLLILQASMQPIKKKQKLAQNQRVFLRRPTLFWETI